MFFLLSILLLPIPFLHAFTVPLFENLFPVSGLSRSSPPSLKFGGPFICDLNHDTFPDIFLTHHNRNFSRLYLSTPNASTSFSIYRPPGLSAPFRPRVLDVHGISIAPLHTRTNDRLFALSVGGGRGLNARAAEIYRFGEGGAIVDVGMENGTARNGIPIEDIGLGRIKSRPRNAVFMELGRRTNRERRRDWGGPDVLFVNFLIGGGGGQQFAYRNVRGQFQVQSMIGGFAEIVRGRVGLVDLEMDGVMEVVSVQELRVFRLVSAFNLTEVTDEVLPRRVSDLSVAAICEFDLDNDGWMDLYVARADARLISNLRTLPDSEGMDDIILRNTGEGNYEEIEGGLGGNSVGVTAGDFDNDGWLDLVVVQDEEPDVVLMNNGNGTFERFDGLIPKAEGTVGNNAVAVDYDGDGGMDVVMGHGGVMKGRPLGEYLLLRNVLTERGNWLRVRVLNDPSRASTALHAVVTLFLRGRRRQVRRVGDNGAQEAMGSFIETLHFGLGSETVVRSVRVKWTSRIQRSMRDVTANQLITMGREGM